MYILKDGSGNIYCTSENEIVYEDGVWKIDEISSFVGAGLSTCQVTTVPEDFELGKYLYQGGELVLNEDYHEYVSPEEQLATLQAKIAELETANQTLTDCLLEISESVYA